MAKSGKKSKLSTEVAALEQDPNIVYSNGEFSLPNGDKYIGDFCAHRFGLIWREGHGTYITHDGQSYEGEWKDDKLLEGKPVTITYPSGEIYQGCIREDKYFGSGIYTMDNTMLVCCDFVDNQPKGNVALIDFNRRVWEGEAGPNKVLLLPENEFYTNITKLSGIGPLVQKDEVVITEDYEKDTKPPPPQPRESEIFKETTKTVNDIDFTDSKWYQRYQRYRTMKDIITYKMLAEDRISLTKEEKKWYRKYREHKRKKREEAYKSVTQEDLVNTSLLDKYYSKEFKESCKPFNVFYPTVDWLYDQNVLQANEPQKSDK